MTEKILVSACLCRKKCRYDGKILESSTFLRHYEHKRHAVGGSPTKSLRGTKSRDNSILISVCPEQLGGLPTPRTRSFVTGTGKGGDVLLGKEKVVNAEGKDITKNFIKGAKKTLQVALRYKIKKAFLKTRSPSCGENGVTSALLKKSGIKIKWVD